MANFGLHWFRRDLRVAGNSALLAHWKKQEGRVVGVFFLDPQILKRKDTGPARLQFFIANLKELQKELRSIGGDLLVLKEAPEKGFPHLFKKCKPSTVSFNEDYEPYARKRDAALSKIFQTQGMEIITGRDHLIFHPRDLTKDDQSFYKVYTPYKKKWLGSVRNPAILKFLKHNESAVKYLKKQATGQAERIFKLKWKDVYSDHATFDFDAHLKTTVVPLPKAGSLAAFQKALDFKKKVDSYKEARDMMAEPGTSFLSPYLKAGVITSGLLIEILDLLSARGESGASTYLSELIWREFYYSILWNQPSVEKESFNPKYKNLKWENNEKYFEAWKKGRTGFPIVDAAMRQLNTTGWMHNRARMIVASFLTKDLLIDWKWGEAYFMEKLLDGDMAANNGGWQWAASTGCDPQPYFRIFNPRLQGERYDPNGAYVKRFVPELAGFSVKEIYDPDVVKPGYPQPIVDHDEQKPKALALFKIDS